MSLLSDLGTKIGTKLKELHTAVNGKLSADATAVNSDKLEGKTYQEVRNGVLSLGNDFPFYVDFYVGGDADKYYPVFFQPHDDWYGPQKFMIERGYSWTAPSTWNNSTTHKGGLALMWEATDTQWDAGVFNYVKLTYAREVYQRIYANAYVGSSGSYGPIIVYLRGGNAKYRFHTSIKQYTVLDRTWDYIPEDVGPGSRGLAPYGNIVVIDDAPTQTSNIVYETYGTNTDGTAPRDIRKISGKAWYTTTEVYDDNIAPKPLAYHTTIDDPAGSGYKLVVEGQARTGIRFTNF